MTSFNSIHHPVRYPSGLSVDKKSASQWRSEVENLGVVPMTHDEDDPYFRVSPLGEATTLEGRGFYLFLGVLRVVGLVALIVRASSKDAPTRAL